MRIVGDNGKEIFLSSRNEEKFERLVFTDVIVFGEADNCDDRNEE